MSDPAEPLPLNVRVARAIGCEPYQATNEENVAIHGFWICPCATTDGESPHGGPCDALDGVDKHWNSGYWLKPYGEDSPEGHAVTGALMLRFMLGVTTDHGYGPDAVVDGTSGSYLAFWANGWWDCIYECWNDECLGKTTVEAVALLVVSLAEAGRLPK